MRPSNGQRPTDLAILSPPCPSLSSMCTRVRRNSGGSGGSRGGGSRGSGPPPPFGPRCRLFNIGPKVGPPPFCEGVFFKSGTGKKGTGKNGTGKKGTRKKWHRKKWHKVHDRKKWHNFISIISIIQAIFSAENRNK